MVVLIPASFAHPEFNSDKKYESWHSFAEAIVKIKVYFLKRVESRACFTRPLNSASQHSSCEL